MKNKTDFSIGIGILVFCTVMLQQIMLLPAPAGSELFSARSFPLGINIFLFILSALLVYSSFKNKKTQSEWPVRRIVFALSTFLFLIIAQLITGYRNLLKIFLIAGITTIFFYFIFVHFFKVPLP